MPDSTAYMSEVGDVFSLESEQSVIGSLILDPDCISTIIGYLTPEMFYSRHNGKIFKIAMEMFTIGEIIDPVTILVRTVDQGVFENESDAKLYIGRLAETVPTTKNVESYCKIVRDKYYIRAIRAAAGDIIVTSSDAEYSSTSLLNYAEKRIFEVRRDNEVSGMQELKYVLLGVYDRLQKMSGTLRTEYIGLPTGFSGLDNMLTGLNKSDLILIAARPGMGKTSFILNIAGNVARNNKKSVVIFSLEMSAEQLAMRMLSFVSLIGSEAFRTGRLKDEEWIKLAEASQVLSEYNIHIDDSPGITVPKMMAKLRRLRGQLGLVLIDYLQLMSTGRRSENRAQEISEITRHLKMMAKELDVPVITCSQLSREPEKRADHRPMLSDLRESGSIEQDADIVMFLYRDDYYRPDSPDRGFAECIIAKNRHGEVGRIRMGWDGEHTRFLSVDNSRMEEM